MGTPRTLLAFIPSYNKNQIDQILNINQQIKFMSFLNIKKYANMKRSKVTQLKCIIFGCIRS